MKFILSLVLIILFPPLFCQDTSKIISKYRIVDSWHNGNFLSSFDQERKGELCIHYDQKNQLSLSNISVQDSSYSTGKLVELKFNNAFNLNKSKTKSQVQYLWYYSNSYNKNKGVAKITLIEEETNYGRAFQMTIIHNKNKEKIVYKGFKIDESNQYIIPKTLF